MVAHLYDCPACGKIGSAMAGYKDPEAFFCTQCKWKGSKQELSAKIDPLKKLRTKNERILKLKKKIRSHAELVRTPLDKTKSIIQGLLPEGAVVLITGSVKGSGKTTFAFGISASVIHGKAFLGRKTKKGKVVYCSEQSRRSIDREYAKRFGIHGSDNFFLLEGFQSSGYSLEEVLAAAGLVADEQGAQLIIIDTFSYFARVDDENDAAEIQRLLRPLQDAAAKGKTIILVHHERKSGGNPWESTRGSSALAGGVDIIIQLKRLPSSSKNTVRELRAEGRYADLLRATQIELTSSGYVDLGKGESSARFSVMKGIVGALTTDEASALSRAEIRNALARKELDVSQSTVARALSQLEKDGAVSVLGEGTKSAPQRFHLNPDVFESSSSSRIIDDDDHSEDPLSSSSSPTEGRDDEQEQGHPE